jgi:acyl-CoA synthetase (AMP-forming)/AMP-acid ligase II
MTASTVARLVLERAEDDHAGLRFEDRSWTWAEVVRECAVRAAVLEDLRGVGPFHIGVLLDNVPEYVFLLGGAALAGATIVGINPTRRGNELAADVRHTDCVAIVSERDKLDLLAGIDTGVPDDQLFDIDAQRWQSLLDAHRGASLPTQVPAPDTQYVLVFTSGSTGAPKAVRGTQGRYSQFGASMPFTHDDVLYCSMPLFHGNALASSFVPAITTGATLALRRRFSASEFFDDLRRYDATFFNTVGRALSYVLATPPAANDREHRVKFALGPESSPADVQAFRERFGIPVVQGYGQSEGVIVLTPARRAQPGALGIAAPGQDLAVVDPETGTERELARFDGDGRFLNAAAAIGELVRRDAGVCFEGYYNNDDAAAARRRNGWYWSGDLAYRDQEGVYYFAGRNSDWLRVDAENFAAAPVERILGRHPDAAMVAVYAVADPITGDQVMAALELHPGTMFDPDAFATFLASQRDLGTKWSPRFVRIVDAMPVTGTDKIDKKPLRSAGWRTHDPLWWRPERNAAYRPFTADDDEALAAQFRTHGREHLLPAAE